MGNRRRPRAFIVHGRDLEPRHELEKFLRSMGVDVLPFHRAVGSRSHGQTTLGLVLDGIKRADVVLVLFTPDEQAVFHDPQTGAYHGRPGDAQLEGWQARPNVIFEAGVAMGVAARKTFILKLGPTREFSDLGGVAYVHLDHQDGKKVLRDLLVDLLKLKPRAIDDLAGEFSQHSRRRWRYYGELDQLELALSDIKPYASKRTLHTMVRQYAIETAANQWNASTLANYIFSKFDVGQGYTADSAFWYLTIIGVLSFDSINDWDEEMWWANAVEHSVLTDRGRGILHKLETLALER